MADSRVVPFLVVIGLLALGPALCLGAGSGPGVCLPDQPIPPESIGPVPIPFDVPIWPTLVKTEFHILPWLTFGKASICIPGMSKALELPAPCLSLKPIPVWFPWLRPLDVECCPPVAVPYGR